ncbi:MAG TPA: hypothetical protein P5050_08620 [Bacteroidia bacterium]|nr:hypothetical protein [Bacteroidia bacterium]HRS59268.1 hypothetical protein [Bacteroidia bacterium]HRU67142.1 hypothetical protein [Bacteroidia bacterium]
MGFLRFILLLILLGIAVRLIRFLILLYLANQNFRKKNKPYREGETKIHHVPKSQNFRKNGSDDEYVNYEETQ